jgi:hypothetical protein
MKNRKIVMSLFRDFQGSQRFEGFEVHTNCGMNKNPENLNAHEITVLRKELMHNLGY